MIRQADQGAKEGPLVSSVLQEALAADAQGTGPTERDSAWWCGGRGVGGGVCGGIARCMEVKDEECGTE